MSSSIVDFYLEKELVHIADSRLQVFVRLRVCTSVRVSGLCGWVCFWVGVSGEMELMHIVDSRLKVCQRVQGGEDSQDPLSCRSFATKEPLNIGHFWGK